ncbi:FRG domain-containing protein [Neptuniibacter sp. 1_MG-2023]|uniref:FRG domain-containing protein n=1 Tax=Neptuniibacter sp. 1_MG-2023 TaxID=3062662 RepID=UPI0026E38F1B|nr:FRG domain-containing protein [Neptuniibacter sp. 1_MG-2023]MDO6594453.1 FRG domain-containing protein [Neptuniibacter sp. 1_MG-2023]
MTKLYEVASWQEFLALVESEELRGWAFRGQCDASWDLESSLTRRLKQFVPKDRWAEQEGRAIRVFKRKAHYFLNDTSALDDDFRCLALMQHHGAPTRLLDFTKSPYVASYFALHSSTTTAAVYAVNTPALWHEATPPGFPEQTRDAIDPRNHDLLHKYYLSNQYPVVWPGEPWSMDRRIVAQAGTFIIPGKIDVSVAELLTNYDYNDIILAKIIIPNEIRSEAMEALYRMNISHATLFPDLDGLARSISYELEASWVGSSASANSNQ